MSVHVMKRRQNIFDCNQSVEVPHAVEANEDSSKSI